MAAFPSMRSGFLLADISFDAGTVWIPLLCDMRRIGTEDTLGGGMSWKLGASGDTSV
jgi:hypothetical protein